MTREEAINILNRDDDSMRKGYFCINDFKAIEVLQSEEPILDKIRAEIEELPSYVARFNGGDFAIHIDKEKVLKIIDKYRGES